MSQTSALGMPTFYMTEKFMLTKVKFFLDRNGDDTVSDPSETSLEMDTSTLPLNERPGQLQGLHEISRMPHEGGLW